MQNITKKNESRINKNTIFLALIILILAVLLAFTIIDIFLDVGISWSVRNSMQEFLEINPAALNLALDLFISGTLLMISLFAFLIYVGRSHKLYFLYYSILSFIIALGLLLSADSIHLISSSLSFDISYKLSLIVYLSIPVFILFTEELFPDQFADKILILVNLITVLFYLLVFIMPAENFKNLHYFNIFLLPVFFYVIYILFRAAAEGEKNALPFLANIIFLTAAMINDLLYAENIIESIFIIRSSLFVFLIFQALILMKYSSDNVARREKKIEKLSQENDYLKKKENIKDEFMIENLEELNLPIDAVMSSAESILHNGIFVNEELRTDLADVINNSRGLKYLLRNLKEYFQHDSKLKYINEEEIELRSNINQIISFYNIYLKEKNIKLENNITKDKFFVRADKSNFVILIFNILDNIILQIDKGNLVLSAEEQEEKIILNIELKNSKITLKHNEFLTDFQNKNRLKGSELLKDSYNSENKILNKIDFKQHKIKEILELISASLEVEKNRITT